MPILIDAHAHLQFEEFNKDRDEVIKRALNQNIWLINIGANKESSQKAVAIARQYPAGVLASVGLHPHNINEDFDYNFYKNLAQEPKVVAVGECGLDYKSNEQKVVNNEIKEKQKEILIWQIELAKEVGKPLMIHCREAFSDLIKILNSKSYILNSPPGILHFFSGALEDAKKLLTMEFYFTFGGLITFNRSFDEIIRYLPLEKILLETDAPYVAPEPYRNKRNEPVYVIEVARKLAEIKKLPFKKVAEQTMANAIDIFKL